MNVQRLFLSALFCAVLSAPAWAVQAKAVIGGTAPGIMGSGEASFTEENNGVAVEASVSGLAPGKHGFHIHENGSCDDGGKAAGGHFNPDKVMHGYMPKDGMQHAHPGDMGNLEAGSDGKASLKVFLPGVSLTGDKYNVMGKAVVVHEKPDDFSQPTGNAGGRIGCGVITAK